MAAQCGRPYDHDKHLDLVEGVIIKCDGDASKYDSYDDSTANKPS